MFMNDLDKLKKEERIHKAKERKLDKGWVKQNGKKAELKLLKGVLKILNRMEK